MLNLLLLDMLLIIDNITRTCSYITFFPYAYKYIIKYVSNLAQTQDLENKRNFCNL